MRTFLVLAAVLATGGRALSVPRTSLPQHLVARPVLARSGAVVLAAASSTEIQETVQQTIAANTVVLYSKSWCPYCAQSKALFDEMLQPYTAIELDQLEPAAGEQLQAALLEMTQQRTVPNVFVAGQHIGGNDDTQQAARSGKLAELLGGALSTEASAGRVVPTASPSSMDPVAYAFNKLLFPGGSKKQIFFGVLQRDVESSAVPSEDERARLRASAATELTNIDAAERDRRRMAGGAFALFSAALAAGLLGSHVAPLTRAAIAPPLFLAYGFLASAQTGL